MTRSNLVMVSVTSLNPLHPELTHTLTASSLLSLNMDIGRPRIEFVKALGHWVRWEEADSDDPQYFKTVPLSATAVANVELDGMDPQDLEEPWRIALTGSW